MDIRSESVKNEVVKSLIAQKPRLLVLGRGYLAREFFLRGHELFDNFRWDGSNHDVIRDYLNERPEIKAIVNCIGKTDTTWCEFPENFEEAFRVNAMLPKILSKEVVGNRKLVHISTGCLYGDGHDRSESDKVVANSRYTLTKLTGEYFLKPDDLILRPRLLFGHEGNPQNYLTKIKRYSQFTDAPNSLTSSRTLVRATEVLVSANQSGVFNVAQRGGISPSSIAKLLSLDGNVVSIERLRRETENYPIANVMNITKLERFFTPKTVKDEIKDLAGLVRN